MEVLADIGQCESCAAVHSCRTVYVDNPIAFLQKTMHCLLKLWKPVADVCLKTVGSIQAFVSVWIFMTEPGRGIILVRAVDHMGNVASNLEDRS